MFIAFDADGDNRFRDATWIISKHEHLGVTKLQSWDGWNQRPGFLTGGTLTAECSFPWSLPGACLSDIRSNGFTQDIN